MAGMRSQKYLRLFIATLVSSIVSLPAFAQPQEPDPNSPTPIIVRAEGSKRVLAVPAETGARVEIRSRGRDAFTPSSRVAIFVTNIELMNGEGANAFRVHVEDSRGKRYRFPVVDLYRIKAPTPTYALIFEMRDEIGYWDPPAFGDVLIRVAWRGMTSDRARLGYGKSGGPLKDDVVPFSKLHVSSPTPRRNDRFKGDLDEPQYVGYRWAGDRRRFLEQAGFGPTELLDHRIRRIGIRTWLEEQFEIAYPSASNPFPDNPLKPSNAPADCDNDQTVVPDVPPTCFRDTYTMYPLQAWFFKEAYYGDAQLRHRVAWALSQIWVISGVDTQQSRWMTEYYKVLANNSFGNYRDLMRQMTLNPGMGNYLDMARSTRTNPNENYAREFKQLFTVGLFLLNQDGTLQLDGQGQPIPTYEQADVNNFTKVLTGWGFCNTGCPNSTVGVVNYIDPLVMNAGLTNVNNNRHDLTAKTLLNYPGATNTTIPACTNCTSLANIATYSNNSMEQTIDNLFNHPNVGPFVGKILIQHLVTSDPTPAYVSRVAAAFNNNGSGVRGDMKAVIRAILLDPEARGDVKTDPNFGKLREPVQWFTNIARSIGVVNAAQNGPSDGVFYSPTSNLLSAMAQTVFYSPTVFNYYSPDFVIPGTAMLGPEFALMTTGTAVARANFANTMIIGNGVAVSGVNVPSGTRVFLAELQALAAADTTGGQLLDVLNQRMMHGNMSAAMRNEILTAVTSISVSNPPTETQSLNRARQALYLVATSSQYQVQR
ncbi:MAG TPA: DUF1800 domain-containing protein [Pyrinomonadaceae bacterium]|nr:DUF1800 domain-containing protein [Pyrinomonadaceae bacterium]